MHELLQSHCDDNWKGTLFFFCLFCFFSAAAVHDDKNEVSNDDFNTIGVKKLNEFKSSTISELMENMKVLIQSEYQNTMQKYENHLEEESSAVAMLQQRVTNLKQENLNIQERTRIYRQNLEKYCEENEQYSRHLCLGIKNKKMNAPTKSWK